MQSYFAQLPPPKVQSGVARELVWMKPIEDRAVPSGLGIYPVRSAHGQHDR